jgi:peptidylprolyl isomerase
VVDNWVAQWGGGEGEGFAVHALPEGVVSPVTDYQTQMWCEDTGEINADGEALTRCSPDFGSGGLPDDPYARNGRAGWVDGWPTAFVFDRNAESNQIWPIHCYASVGVARDMAPDTGTGAELYAVIGHAPRQLDRNIAVIGRVISGIEHLSTLPRGTGEAGVYETRAEDTPIVSVRLGDELPELPHFEYLTTDSESFARYVESRANRNDAFYTVPAGGVDVCNVQVPIRPAAL